MTQPITGAVGGIAQSWASTGRASTLRYRLRTAMHPDTPRWPLHSRQRWRHFSPRHDIARSRISERPSFMTRVGLIGCGAWGCHILRDLKVCGAVTHVADPSEDARRNAQAAGAD